MKYTKTSKTNIQSKKILIAILLLAVGLATLLFFLEKRGTINLYGKGHDEPAVTTPEPQINYDPPTPIESSAGDAKKQELVEKEEPTSNPEKPNSAEVVIVDASQYDQEIEVRAFISNTLHEGTCSFDFTQSGQQTIHKELPAYPDASTTPCITLTLPRSDFPASGVWQLSVTYESDSVVGSAKQEVEIR